MPTWQLATRTRRNTDVARRVACGVEIILVDASNVARARGGRRASYADLLALEQHLIQQGFDPHLVADASLRHRMDAADAEHFDERVLKGEIVQVPKGTDADQWLVAEAERLGACIVTNDRMQEWQAGRPWLAERLVRFEAGQSAQLKVAL